MSQKNFWESREKCFGHVETVRPREKKKRKEKIKKIVREKEKTTM